MCIQQKKFINNFFELCLLRTFFTNYPFTFVEFKHFLKFSCSKIFTTFFSSMLSRNILKGFHIKNKKIFLDISFKDFFLKEFYLKDISFPSLNLVFKMKRDLVLLQNSKILRKTKIKNLLFFFNDIISFNGTKPSIQFILFLKSAGMLENSIYRNEIRITNPGIHFTLSEPNIQFFNFLENFSKKNFFLLEKRSNITKSFLTIFYTKHRLSHNFSLFKRFDRMKKENILEIWVRISKDLKLNAKLIHGFSSKCSYMFWFFHELKILFFPRFIDKIFYPYSSISGSSKIKSNSSKYKKTIIKSTRNFQIIIESNYRIYVYNSNDSNNFLIKLLLQFSDLLYNLPNLFVGEITKISINKAIKSGISAKSIIGFVEKNLHSICKNIPPTVVNQIRAWELQREGISINDYLIIFKTFQKIKNNKKKFLNWNIKSRLYIVKNKICVLQKK
jgi:hypothetical protein